MSATMPRPGRNWRPSRRGSATETFASWFTTAAVALAILFDADAIQALGRYLDLDDDTDFSKAVDKLADVQDVDAATVLAYAEELGFEVVSRELQDDGGSNHGRSAGSGVGSLPLGGLDPLGGLGDETLARNDPGDDGGHRFTDPDLSNGLNFEAGELNLLDDETTGDAPPPDPGEEETPPEEEDPPEEETAPDPPEAGGSGMEDVTAGEGDGFAVFTITRTSGDGEASVSFATADGSAIAAQDYTATAGSVHFADGQTAVTVTVALIDDGSIEPSESFQLTLSDPDNLILEDTAATATILDDEVADLTWSVAGDQMVTEGAAAAYTVAFDGGPLAPGQEVSVRLRLSLPGGDGGAEADDFSVAFLAEVQAAIDALGPDAGLRLDGDRLVFSADGPSSLTLYLDTTDDGLVEGPENFTLLIEDPSVGNVATGDGILTTVIADNDTDQISWSLTGDATVSEGEDATYTLRLDGAEMGTGQEASVSLALDLPGGPDGAEAADLQQTLLSALQDAIDGLGPNPGVRLDGERIVFSAGAPRSLAFRLDTENDRLAERTETYRLSLGTPSVGTVAAAVVATAILDDDASALVWRLTGDQLVTEGGAPSYRIDVTGAELTDDAPVSIDLAINLPNAAGGAGSADFSEAFYKDIQDAIDGLGPDAGVSLDGTTLVFGAGFGGSFTFALPTADDALREGAENFTVVFGTPSDGRVDAAYRLVTTAILDNDEATPVTGTPDGDTLTGDDGANDLSGLAGNDSLFGLGGIDILRGGPGADYLNGGAGGDRYDGGPGADVFAYDVVDLGTGLDRIVDFRPDEGDSLHVLDLLTGFETTMVDIDAFIRFQEREEGTFVQLDADGSGDGARYVDAILLEAVHGVTVDQLMADNHLMVN